MDQELPGLENLCLAENYLEALRLVDAALVKSPKNIGFLKQKASLIQLAPQSKYTLRDAEKCLLRAHQLAHKNLDVINDLVRLYEKNLKNPGQREYFYNLFCAIVENKTGLPE